MYYESPQDIIGKTVTIQYFEESKNQCDELIIENEMLYSHFSLLHLSSNILLQDVFLNKNTNSFAVR